MTEIHVFEREPDWRKPVIAQSEEMPDYYAPEMVDPRFESGVMHALSPADYERAMAGMICPQCLTPFPAPVGPEHMKRWRSLTSDDWRPELSGDQLASIFQGQCPICAFPCGPDSLALHDMGETENESEQWRDEIAGFDDRAKAYYEELQRRNRSQGTRRGGRVGWLRRTLWEMREKRGER